MANPVKWMLTKVKEVNSFIWATSISDSSKRRGILIRYLRIMVLAARGFVQDKVQLRAASLTFFTLLTVIPMAAIAFGVAKGFGLEADLERELIKEFSSHQEVLNWILNNARSALQETKGGYMAGVGAVILFWSVMQLLDHIETSLNHIWQVRQSRPWLRKFTDYLAIMLVAPVFIILSSSITVFISTKLTEFMANAPILEFFKPAVTTLFKIAPYIIMWLVLTFTYIVLTNAKVRFTSALLGGIVAGTLIQIVQWLYLDLQFGITRLSAIYGSFAAFPLFIVWIQTTWLIVLLGAELSFAKQNVHRYEFEHDAKNISIFQRKLLTLLLLNLVVRSFKDGTESMGAERLASCLKIPIRVASDILYELREAGLVSEIIIDQDKQRVFQPGIDINKLTIGFVLSRLDRKGTEHTIGIRTSEYEKILKTLNVFEDQRNQSPENIYIKDL
jgi:membrane protein